MAEAFCSEDARIGTEWAPNGEVRSVEGASATAWRRDEDEVKQMCRWMEGEVGREGGMAMAVNGPTAIAVN